MGSRPTPRGMPVRARTLAPEARLRTWAARAGLLVASTALSLFGAELIVRAAGWAPQIHVIEITGGAYQSTDDPRLPYAPVAGRGHFNAHGMRDRLRDGRPLLEAPRAVAIGDSILFGGGSPVSKIFTSRLEDKLRAHDPRLRGAEVWNMGVPGYDTINAVAHFERSGLRLAPDLVILGYCINDKVTQSSELRELARHPRRREQARLRSLMAKHAMAKSELVRLFLFHTQPDEPPAERHSPAPPPYGNVQQGFARLGELARTHGFGVAVVIFPFLEPFTRYKHGEDHRRVARMARQHGFEVLDLLPSFRNTFRDDAIRLRVHRHDRLHLNAEAHEHAAKVALPFIARVMKGSRESR